MPSAVRASLPALLLALLLAAAQARANPHVWVEAGITFAIEDHRVTALTFAWRFDDYYSSHAMQSYDLDGNRLLESTEVAKLRSEAFDPLAQFGHYVHVWAGGRRREGLAVQEFSARVDKAQLVYEFSMPITPPADFTADPMIVSLFDRRNAVDFRFADSDFLLVDGEVKAGCKFRIARGSGEQSGHPRPVTLQCGG